MRFVAFMGVLGFKEMVENSTREKLVRVYNNAFISNATFALSNGKFITVNSHDGQYVTADLSQPLSSCLIVSDSVMFWTEDTSITSFVNIWRRLEKHLYLACIRACRCGVELQWANYHI